MSLRLRAISKDLERTMSLKPRVIWKDASCAGHTTVLEGVIVSQTLEMALISFCCHFYVRPLSCDNSNCSPLRFIKGVVEIDVSCKICPMHWNGVIYNWWTQLTPIRLVNLLSLLGRGRYRRRRGRRRRRHYRGKFICHHWWEVRSTWHGCRLKQSHIFWLCFNCIFRLSSSWSPSFQEVEA